MLHCEVVPPWALEKIQHRKRLGLLHGMQACMGALPALLVLFFGALGLLQVWQRRRWAGHPGSGCLHCGAACCRVLGRRDTFAAAEVVLHARQLLRGTSNRLARGSATLPPCLALFALLLGGCDAQDLVSTTRELTLALHSGAAGRIVLAAGTYELDTTDPNLCSMDSTWLCVNRAVTIEAAEPGAVELDAMGQRRVLFISYLASEPADRAQHHRWSDERQRESLLFERLRSTLRRWMTFLLLPQGGGLYNPGDSWGAAALVTLNHCNIYQNMAGTDVRCLPEAVDIASMPLVGSAHI